MLFIAPLLYGLLYSFAGYGVYKLIDSEPRIVLVRKMDEDKSLEKNI